MKVAKHLSACTSVLVGKQASVDGSTMIARNDDTFLPLTPQRFYVHPAEKINLSGRGCLIKMDLQRQFRATGIGI